MKQLAIGAAIVGILGLCYLLALANVAAEREQHDYMAQHHCVLAAHEDARTVMVTGGHGGFIFMPERNTYNCDGVMLTK